MLHPVGKLPAAVYWRRRVLVLLVLVSVFGGGSWLATTGIGRWRANAASAAAASTTVPVPTPALEQVVPSPAALQTPVPAALTASTSVVPCTDAMISVAVRAPARASVGARTTVELVVTNTSAASCRRAVDPTLQQVVLLDAHGARVWGSDDCMHESRSDPRILAAGQAVSFPLGWDGRTSEPTCSGARVPPSPGEYVLRGRLGTKVSADAPLTLS